MSAPALETHGLTAANMNSAGQAVAEPPVVLRPRGVGALAEQRVAERELALVGEPAPGPHREHLLLDQPREPLVTKSRWLPN